MLLLPKGQVVFQDLKTAFTQFDAMLGELCSNGFTGYVHLTAPAYEGLLLLDTGQVLTAMDESQGRRRTGPLAAQELAAQARTKDGTIDVCRLSPEWIGLLSGMTEGETIYGNISTDVVDLEALIKKLQSSRHSGYVQVSFRAGGENGFVLLQDGELIGCLPSSENGESPAVVLSRLVQTASTCGADIVVYKAEIERALSNSRTVAAGLDMPRLLEVWQAIIQTVENTANSLTEKGAFANAFRSELERRARDHPFLDPSNMFVYRDGQLKYNGSPEKDFNRRVAECLTAAIGRLETKERSGNLKTRIKIALQTVREKHSQSILALGLENAIAWELSPYERVLREAWPFLGVSTERIVERQCREHLGLEPSALAQDQLRDLARWMEISSALVISKDQARAMRQRIEALSEPLQPPGARTGS